MQISPKVHTCVYIYTHTYMHKHTHTHTYLFLNDDFFLFSFLSFSKLMIFFLPKVKNIISTMKNDHKVCPFGDNDTIQLRDSVSSLLWGKKSKNSKATMRPAPAPTPAWESLSLPFWSCPGVGAWRHPSSVGRILPG